MSNCARVEAIGQENSVVACPPPEEYPENPSVSELVYALNDTYLAWETCRSAWDAYINK